MAETKMDLVWNEIKNIISMNNSSGNKKISHFEIEVVAKYLNKIVVTYENKHLLFCKKLKDDVFFIKGYKNVTLGQLDGGILSQKFFIKNDFKEVFFNEVLDGDNLFNYNISSKEFTFNKLDDKQIINFISKFRSELVIDSLDWFFFELPKYLIENYSKSDFEFKE
jgi:hypothetical protein